MTDATNAYLCSFLFLALIKDIRLYKAIINKMYHWTWNIYNSNITKRGGKGAKQE